MPELDLGGRWSAWTSPAVADTFYRADFSLVAEHHLDVPGHWQLTPELQDYQGSVFYRTSFDWQPTLTWPVTRLRLGGAFYQTTVWLNEQLIGKHAGYFSPMSWEIRPEQLLPQGNILAIRVDCPPPGVGWRDVIIGVYGEWEAKPSQINPGGIWGEVVLEETFRGYLADLQLDAKLTAWQAAQVKLQGDFIWRSVSGQIKATVKIAPRNFVGKEVSQEFSLPVEAGNNRLELKLSIPEPRIWWTWDQGHPNLYDVHLVLTDEQEDEVDSFTTYLGIREVAWKNWQFYLNGRRVFLRGANHGPGSFYPATVTVDELQQDVRLLKESNLNMVRLYGHVAPPDFYRICAEMGIAIWQDFPLDKKCERNITGVALHQVRALVTTLRNETAICFWSCHNEPYLSHNERPSSVGGLAGFMVDLFKNVKPSWNKDVLDLRLQEAILQLDSSRPALPHSGVWGLIRGGTAVHHYFGWRTGNYRTLALVSRLLPRLIRLVNSYGAQSIPTDAEFLAELTAQGGEWSELDWEKLSSEFPMDIYLLQQRVSSFGHLDLSSYALATQRYQADLLQYYHEFLRRHKYRPCGGALFYYFVDPAPQISAAILDHRRQPKLAFQATQRAMQPVQVMINWPKRRFNAGEKWSSPIYIVNDLPRALPAMGLVWQLKAGETVLLRERGVAEVGADSVARVGRLTLQFPEELAGTSRLVLQLKLTLPDKKEIINEYSINMDP